MTDTGSVDAAVAELGAQAALETLVRSVVDIAGAAPQPPSRVSVRFGCASVEVEWPQGKPVVTGGDENPPPTVSPQPAAADDRRAVRAPLVGTFYRTPGPGESPFVEVGDLVAAGQQVAIIEAMKLMNIVEADTSGRVVEVLVADAEPVDFDQPLFLLAPAEGR
ncbi:acetyl-CoA carboxylase biotin carboxyl carrier protein [Amycolatopsis rubida]|uniref:Biotin carboxyl carrier protein of acetyl-CoA carboxylase n=1 Tax=Amycolatopsis rubida TaxID=112413 RepID=A0A1I5TM91_9PSEU|nr:biotin/lipoyl-containing protein [Amycolatopsis rubida]SFP83456.1 acetyl-CoA carboxylase biotin carboxyl carrier protein [Amycolatopsis rubida]